MRYKGAHTKAIALILCFVMLFSAIPTMAVSLWTKTLLSGNQGFDTTSPEYGFWYRYFDIYGKIMTLSNLRFVSGSNGRNTGIYRAMPIRLVHVL